MKTCQQCSFSNSTHIKNKFIRKAKILCQARFYLPVDHFDYDFGLGLSLPATITGTDFFNTGRGNTRLGDAEQYLSQVIRGLSGQDAALGMTPLPAEAGGEGLVRVEELFARIRNELGVVIAVFMLKLTDELDIPYLPSLLVCLAFAAGLGAVSELTLRRLFKRPADVA